MSAKNNKSENQHILPQTYLKGFTDKSGKIFKHKLKAPFKAKVIKSFYPKGVAYKADFYKLTNLDRHSLPIIYEENIVEKVINRSYEDDIPKLWSLFYNQVSQINTSQKKRIAEIILHLKERNNFFREVINQPSIKEGLARNLIAIAEKENSFAEILDQLNESEQELFNSKIYKEFYNNFMKSSADYIHNNYLASINLDDQSPLRLSLLDKLIAADWTIVVAKEPHSFILSDNVGITKNYKHYSNFNFVGSFEFIFPISSQLLLYIKASNMPLTQRTSEKITYVNGTPEEVRRCNLWMSLTSQQEIYGSSEVILRQVRDDWDSERYFEKKSRS